MSWFDNLKKIKLESGMSTHEIAKKSGLPEPTLEKIFSGSTKSPGINTVQTIVHALGCTLNDIDPSPQKITPLAPGGKGERTVSESEYRIVSAYRVASDADRGIIDNIVDRYSPAQSGEAAG